MKKISLHFAFLTMLIPSISHSEFAINNRFVELMVGGTSTVFKELNYLNPLGTGFTTNPTRGNYIVLNDSDKANNSNSIKATIGGQITEEVSMSLSIMNFEEISANGYADKAGFDTEQKITVSGQSIILGFGSQFKRKNTFLEPKIEAGISNIKSTGVQVNGFGGVFPENTETNGVLGFSVTAGYELTPKTAVVGSFGYHYFGNIKTKTTTAGLGMNEGERLEGLFNTLSVYAGLRYRF